MKIAIIGSRRFAALDKVREFVQRLSSDDTVISGGAVGVDSAAEQAARLRGLPILIFRPDYTTYGKTAPLVRNHDIVRAAERVVAFWDGASRGTSYTVKIARALGKPVEIITHRR